MNRTFESYTDRSAGRSASQIPFGPATWFLAAGALVAYGLGRRSKTAGAVAAAGSLLAFAATKTAASTQDGKAHATFLINTTPERAYGYWRDFENLPRFMAHLESVRMLENGRSEWIVNGPAGTELRWTARITEDLRNQRIGWRSSEGSAVETWGTVEFRPDPQGRGTFVTANVHYKAPGGIFGKAVATTMGKNPDFMVKEDLRRFKSLLEAGEVPTTAGQTHGPRGIHGTTERALFRENSNMPQPQANARYRKTA